MKYGDIYEGHFKDGQPFGKCRWYQSVVYEGVFNGYFPSTNSVYKINFNDKNDVLMGYFDIQSQQIKGTLSKPEGDTTFGQFTLEGEIKSYQMKLSSTGSTVFTKQDHYAPREIVSENEFWTEMNLMFTDNFYDEWKHLIEKDQSLIAVKNTPLASLNVDLDFINEKLREY